MQVRFYITKIIYLVGKTTDLNDHTKIYYYDLDHNSFRGISAVPVIVAVE